MNLGKRDIIVIAILLVLAIIPDPTDIIDFGTPILEFIVMGAYLLATKRKMLGG